MANTNILNKSWSLPSVSSLWWRDNWKLGIWHP